MLTARQKNIIIKVLQQTEPTLIGLFGSYARNEASVASDIDILFSPTKPIGLFTLSALQRQLEERLKIKVDLVTKNGLSNLISKDVYKDLQIIYEA
jgi:predicted nucleotidyltransferase